MENDFDITISNTGKERIGMSSNSITFERFGLGEHKEKPIIKIPIKPKRKIRKIFIYSIIIQILILISMELFLRSYFFKVLLGWFIAVIGFIIIPSIRRKIKEVKDVQSN